MKDYLKRWLSFTIKHVAEITKIYRFKNVIFLVLLTGLNYTPAMKAVRLIPFIQFRPNWKNMSCCI